MTASTVSCPNCGYGFEHLRKSTRMFDCPSCDTTLFREADALEPLGNHGEMHDVAMLIELGDQVRTVDGTYLVLGHIRYDYGRGFWDEFWAEDENGRGAWISVDEGDVVLQRLAGNGVTPSTPARHLTLGDRFDLDGVWFTVTESDAARAVAFRGQLPERIDLNETHRFINAAGDFGGFASGETWDGGESWFVGKWLDPFTLNVDRGSRA